MYEDICRNVKISCPTPLQCCKSTGLNCNHFRVKMCMCTCIHEDDGDDLDKVDEEEDVD